MSCLVWWRPWAAAGISPHRHLLWPAVVWLVAVGAWEWSRLDLAVVDLIAGRGGFPLRRWWVLDSMLHTGGKWLVVAVAVGGTLVATAAWRVPALRPWWRPALVLAAVIVLATATVGILKALTGVHCPWDLERYGGTAPWQPWWEGPPAGYRRGKGWPAGHASAGFSLLVLYTLALSRSRRPWLWLLPGLILGGVFAAAQVLRGAHFPSHNLYTLAICWGWAVALAPLGMGRPSPAPVETSQHLHDHREGPPPKAGHPGGGSL
jgi:membrane-associated PAP2 superfamily phosphatase